MSQNKQIVISEESRDTEHWSDDSENVKIY